MKHAPLMGGLGMACTFAGGLVVLPCIVFLVATAAGPLFAFGTGLGLIWLALKKTPNARRIDRCRPVRRAAKNIIRPFARTSHD
jgi:hypothetical protein